MSNPKDFFLFCSGADRTILDRVSSDHNKYIGIGGTIFFTGVLAFFSAAYALYTIFDSYIMAVIFGAIWGLMIFNLDRYIISSMKSRGGFFGNFFIALPRLAMAVLLALVISKPLELKIFEKEINSELIVMEQETFKEQEDRIQARFASQIAANELDLNLLQEEVNAKIAARDAAETAALAEADGSGGSGIRNMGPIYRAKRATADQAQAELAAVLAEIGPEIEAKRRAITELRQEVADQANGLERSAYGGMAARIEALDRLAQRSEAIWFASLFVMLLFVAIETAPIFTKLISPKSPYDHLLHRHEHVYAMEAKVEITERANEVKNRLREHTEVGIHRTAANIAARMAEIDREVERSLGLG